MDKKMRRARQMENVTNITSGRRHGSNSSSSSGGSYNCSSKNDHSNYTCIQFLQRQHQFALLVNVELIHWIVYKSDLNYLKHLFSFSASSSSSTTTAAAASLTINYLLNCRDSTNRLPLEISLERGIDWRITSLLLAYTNVKSLNDDLRLRYLHNLVSNTRNTSIVATAAAATAATAVSSSPSSWDNHQLCKIELFMDTFNGLNQIYIDVEYIYMKFNPALFALLEGFNTKLDMDIGDADLENDFRLDVIDIDWAVNIFLNVAISPYSLAAEIKQAFAFFLFYLDRLYNINYLNWNLDDVYRMLARLYLFDAYLQTRHCHRRQQLQEQQWRYLIQQQQQRKQRQQQQQERHEPQQQWLQQQKQWLQQQRQEKEQQQQQQQPQKQQKQPFSYFQYVYTTRYAQLFEYASPPQLPQLPTLLEIYEYQKHIYNYNIYFRLFDQLFSLQKKDSAACQCIDTYNNNRLVEMFQFVYIPDYEIFKMAYFDKYMQSNNLLNLISKRQERRLWKGLVDLGVKLNDCNSCGRYPYYDEECSICLDKQVTCYLEQCAHTFHLHCLVQIKNNKCPLCMQVFHQQDICLFEDCCICLEGNCNAILMCGHVFHFQCIALALRRLCPLCNSAFTFFDMYIVK